MTEDCPVHSEFSPDETTQCSDDDDVDHAAADDRDLQTKHDPVRPEQSLVLTVMQIRCGLCVQIFFEHIWMCQGLLLC